jgi:hypothetical protein
MSYCHDQPPVAIQTHADRWLGCSRRKKGRGGCNHLEAFAATRQNRSFPDECRLQVYAMARQYLAGSVCILLKMVAEEGCYLSHSPSQLSKGLVVPGM